MHTRSINYFKTRRLARQLRKPTGADGIQTGVMMNKANAGLYDLTLDSMQLQQNERILEIGFGNGQLFGKVIARAAGIELHGLDYSHDMNIAAQAHNSVLVQKGILRLTQGSSDKMPYPDAYFDKVYCINVIYFWDNPSPHLQEIKRVLKPGGYFYATIRSKESLEKMPFTKYGFTIYEPEDWKTIFQQEGLHWENEVTRDEPAVTFSGQTMLLEAHCLITKKE